MGTPVRTLVAALGLLGCVGDVEPVARAVAADCVGSDASPTRYLRQLSLDLRGAPPTLDEYRAVMARGSVDEATVDAMLHDPRFLDRVRRWHAALLWPSINGSEMLLGGRLVVVPPRGQYLTVDNINPEWLVEAMDRRTDEPVCPPPTSPSHLTAASCCTAENPTHPACCLVRNRAYNPDDPACVAKSAALPATFNYGVAVGDRQLRGGDAYLGCDSALEYPPPRVALDDRRWLHDAQGRPYYLSPRTGRQRGYYDAYDIPLPYDDATHCPNYCRRTRGTGPGGAFGRDDYAPKERTVDGARVEGDGPGARCPDGFTEVTNPCDNTIEARLTSRVELRVEGWRLTRPWWARGHHVKTCAYEAQERATQLDGTTPCRPAVTMNNACGCGPRGVMCHPFTADPAHPSHTVAMVREAMNREPVELIASIVDRDEDYTTLLTTRRSMVNGALAFTWRNLTDRMGELEFGAPAPPEAIPDLAFEDPEWHSIERSPEHSGVLTMSVFLARFPTMRARANHLRTMFFCQSFTPPAMPPIAADAPCARDLDLAHRCGCSYCHSILEPMGAAWGRWAERGATYLSPERYPVVDPLCQVCVGPSCPPRCRHYVTATLPTDDPPSRGTMQSYLYRSAEDLRCIAEGPRALASAGVRSWAVQSCVARTAWTNLVGRPLSGTEELSVLPILVRDFEAHGRSYRALVRAIVTSAAYRRID